MKDLTEGELIEIEKRSVALVNAADIDPEEVTYRRLKEVFTEDIEPLAVKVSADIDTLCAFVRQVRQCA